MTNDNPQHGTHNDEFYAEPAQLGRADVLGVVLALISLALIGVLGYIWLNPDLDAKSLRSWFKSEPAATSTSTADASKTETEMERGTAVGAESTTCPVCGMYSDRSDSHIVVAWGDGSHSHHDAWDCVFKWMDDQKRTLSQAQAKHYGSPKDAPVWLKAESAAYLYGTKELKISMPPYVAAFKDAAAAEAARDELGGEVLDWPALQQRFGVSP